MGSYKIFITAILCLFSTFTFAAIDPATQQILNQRNQEQYASAMRSAVEKYDQSVEYQVARNQLANQINGTVSAAATVADGSKVASVSTISKVADAAKAASTMAGRFTKASIPAFVGSAAFEGLMKGIGWVMDDGSKVIRMQPTDSSCSSAAACASYKTLYYISNGNDLNFLNRGLPVSYTSSFTNSQCQAAVVKVYGSSSFAVGAFFDGKECQVPKLNASLPVFSASNPAYDSTASPVLPIATQQDIQNAIQKYLQDNPTTDITNNIYIAAYSPDMQFSLSDDTVNGLATEIGKQVADNIALAAQNPNGKATTTLSDGTTVDTQIDTSGKTGTTSNTSITTPNSDGTTTTTSSGSLEFPAFCSWASVMCDWYTWTKTTYDSVVTAVTDFLTPDNNDNTVDLEDPQSDDSSFSFSLPSACPAPVQLIDSSFMGVPINWQYDFSDFCMILSDYVRPILIAMGAFIAVLILGGVRTTDD